MSRIFMNLKDTHWDMAFKPLHVIEGSWNNFHTLSEGSEIVQGEICIQWEFQEKSVFFLKIPERNQLFLFYARPVQCPVLWIEFALVQWQVYLSWWACCTAACQTQFAKINLCAKRMLLDKRERQLRNEYRCIWKRLTPASQDAQTLHWFGGDTFENAQ